ncbi:Two-component sensor histidine kinase, contains HisKA and HATPase domains [Chitinophaga sp. CF118]|uniref:tetratricopeptide repeat-containing sensor histidine kinase n=1 Tax=Chitinophaga sp. CF118 TaxID=1884367 RepID=UPI0008EB3CFA|nr:histidine kinase dimerization/phosphoacceptor domain -containing protein [Chitinophaga sp. CF118]SFD61678.1 Two-component sensor histidine kinase, contains HisKA and HATPase domains [Chitinophaga sp. CF118]
MFRFALIILFFPLTTVSQQQQLSLLQKSKKDTSRVHLLLDLSQYYFSKSDRTPAQLDSGRIYALEAEALSISLHYPLGEGNAALLASGILRVQQQQEKGKQYLKKAMDLFTKYNYKDRIGEAYEETASYYDQETDEGVINRIQYKEKAVAFFEQAGNRRRVGDVEKGIGDYYGMLGKYPEASIHLKKALNAYKSIGFDISMEGLYDLMGIVASMMGDYQEGLTYGLLAVKTSKENKDSSLVLSTIYNRLGLTYLKLTQYEDALNCYRLALPIAERYKDTSSILIIYANIVNALTRLNRLQEALTVEKSIAEKYPTKDVQQLILREITFLGIYRKMKRFPEAQRYCDHVLTMSALKSQNAAVQYFVYKAVIPLFLDTRQYNLAHKYLVINEAYCIKQNTPIDLAENHLLWYKMDSAQGKYLSAIDHLLITRKLNDSLFSETKSRQLSQLKVRYETEQKDQDIRIKEQSIQLLTKKGELQQTFLDKERTTRNAIIGGSVMLVLMLGLGYNRYRLKQRSNIKLQVQQDEINRQNFSLKSLIDGKNILLREKEWLLKEIHHRVKNNLQFIISLLNIQSAYLDNDAAILAIRESQRRMYTMSLIHQKLYQSDEIAFIDMGKYVCELVSYLRDSLVTGSRIHFDLHIDDIELEAVQAAPVGLILNESITNAIKYAFPDNKAGIITIKLLYTETKEILLSVADNGTSLPEDFDLKKKGSLGMTLIETLSEQLEGALNITNNKGLEIAILFKEEKSIRAYAVNDKM